MNVTIKEIAERTKVTSRTSTRWTHKASFPASSGEVAITLSSTAKTYDWDAVKRWLVWTDRWDDIVDIPLSKRRGKQ